MTEYFRPLAQTGAVRPEGAVPLAGTHSWFTHVEILSRSAPPVLAPASAVPDAARERLSAQRAPIAGLAMSAPQLMGILNVTPDSFSDGGQHDAPDAALEAARTMAGQGASILDIGGESTRPGAREVAATEEIARTAPVMRALQAGGFGPMSIDTRKAGSGHRVWQNDGA